MHEKLHKITAWAAMVYCTFGVASSHLEGPELLSELPIEKLLLKRRSVLSELASCNASSSSSSSNNRVSSSSSGASGPVAAALVRPLEHMQIRQKHIDRGHYEMEHEEVEEEEEEEEEEMAWMPMPKGKGKIGKIFDMSVTALAFLAFGGYLICLIVHVIKEKHAAEEEPAKQALKLYQKLLLQQQQQQLLLQQQQQQQRPGIGGAPVHHLFSGLNVRPGRRRRDVPPTDPLLDQLITNGFLFAQEFFQSK